MKTMAYGLAFLLLLSEISVACTVVGVAETTPSSRNVKIVVDPWGAVIPKADIQIYRRGSYPQNQLQLPKTNQEGRFAGSLEPSSYTDIILVPEFRTGVLAVEIARDGEQSELRETLQIAPGP